MSAASAASAPRRVMAEDRTERGEHHGAAGQLRRGQVLVVEVHAPTIDTTGFASVIIDVTVTST